jgi:hypothetical protein
VLRTTVQQSSPHRNPCASLAAGRQLHSLTPTLLRLANAAHCLRSARRPRSLGRPAARVHRRDHYSVLQSCLRGWLMIMRTVPIHAGAPLVRASRQGAKPVIRGIVFAPSPLRRPALLTAGASNAFGRKGRARHPPRYGWRPARLAQHARRRGQEGGEDADQGAKRH